MNRIRTYFNSLADRMAADAELAGVSTHRPDIGTNREHIIEAFLARHLPRRLTVATGGQVVGARETESKQVDVLVACDLAVRFEENRKTFVTVEGLAAAVTVKSVLDRAGLYDCLLNLASIPQLDPQVPSFRLLQNDPFTAFAGRHPSMHIFAFSGVQLNSCVDYLVITFDREFGELVFARGSSGFPGVILLRFVPQSPMEPAELLADLAARPGLTFVGRSTVVDREHVRQRPLPVSRPAS
jgi:hypothetical protein